MRLPALHAPCRKKHGGSARPDRAGKVKPPPQPQTRTNESTPRDADVPCPCSLHLVSASKIAGAQIIRAGRLVPRRQLGGFCQSGSDGSRERVRRRFIALRLKTCLWAVGHMGLRTAVQRCRFESRHLWCSIRRLSLLERNFRLVENVGTTTPTTPLETREREKKQDLCLIFALRS